MTNSIAVSEEEIDELVDLAEKVSLRLAALQEEVERLQRRAVAVTLAAYVLAGIGGGGYALVQRAGLNFDSKAFELLGIVSVAIAVASVLPTFMSIFSRRKFLRREQKRERAVLSRLVDLIENSRSRMDWSKMSVTHQALLDMRLQRIAFDQFE